MHLYVAQNSVFILLSNEVDPSASSSKFIASQNLQVTYIVSIFVSSLLHHDSS